jgi:hypothetical protein
MSLFNNRRNIKIQNKNKQQICDLLIRLSADKELHFFDAFHPAWSDPGAYITVVKYNDGYIYKMGNHGWSSAWHPTDIDRLSRYILKNRDCQEGGIYIQRIVKEIKFDVNEPSNEMFWEDKLELVYGLKNKFSIYEVNGYHLIEIHESCQTYVILEEDEEKLKCEPDFMEYLYNKYYTNSALYQDRNVTKRNKSN